MNEKICWFLDQYYDSFHVALIERAMYDDNISLEDFINGVNTIGIYEDEGDDEYVPKEFKNLVNEC